MMTAHGPFSEAYGAAPSAYLPGNPHYFQPPGLGQGLWGGPLWLGGAVGGTAGALIGEWPPNVRKLLVYAAIGAIGAEAIGRYVATIPAPIAGGLVAIGVSFLA